MLTWLDLLFNTEDMTLSIPPAKLADITQLVQQWTKKRSAGITELRSLLGKLLHVAQCSQPARLFLNRMLATLRACPPHGSIKLSTEFQKDLAWFHHFLPLTNGIFIIHEDNRTPVHIYVDSCSTGCGGLCGKEAYHARFLAGILAQQLSICHLEAINCVVALRQWATQLKDCLVHLHCDSATAVAILQAGRGRDSFLQACAREAWLLTAKQGITLVVNHIAGEELTTSADALSRWHTGDIFKKRVTTLQQLHDVSLVHLQPASFRLSPDL